MDNLDEIIEKYLQNREKEEREKEFDWIPVPMTREEKIEAMKLLTEGFESMIDTSEFMNSI